MVRPMPVNDVYQLLSPFPVSWKLMLLKLHAYSWYFNKFYYLFINFYQYCNGKLRVVSFPKTKLS